MGLENRKKGRDALGSCAKLPARRVNESSGWYFLLPTGRLHLLYHIRVILVFLIFL